MKFDFQTWLNLVRYHVAMKTSKSLRGEWIEKFVDANTNYNILQDRYNQHFTPEQMAEEIATFVNNFIAEKEERRKREREASGSRLRKIYDDMEDRILKAKNNKPKRKKQSLNYQLGCFVGDEIVSRYLFTLSTDPLQSLHVIEVSKEDAFENNRLNKEWFDAPENSKERNEKWELYRKHNHYLEGKYLPSKIECHFRKLDVTNMEEFRKGISHALWDCDMCNYGVTNFTISEEDDMYFTKITLYLDLTGKL